MNKKTPIILVILLSLFSLFEDPCSWALGSETLVLSQNVTTRPFLFVRRVRGRKTILNTGTTTTIDQQSSWQTLNFSGFTTAQAAVLFLSVWALCEKTSVDTAPEPLQGWIEIRQPGQTEWSWKRTIGQIYDSIDANQTYHNIYMDGAHPPFFVMCPTGSSQQIEYQYHFWSTGAGSFRYQFYVELLGYLEGELTN